MNLKETLQKDLLIKAPGVKCFYLQSKDSLDFYADGNQYTLSTQQLPLAKLLCDHLDIDCAAMIPYINDPENISLIRKLLSTSSLELLPEQS